MTAKRLKRPRDPGGLGGGTLRTTLLAATALMVIGGQSAAGNNFCIDGPNAKVQSDDPSEPPLHYEARRTVISIHHGRCCTTLPLGFNPVDEPVNFNCRSPKGCLFTRKSEMSVSGGFSVCTYVDGVPMRPLKPSNIVELSNHLVAPAGPHSVQTKVYAYRDGGVLGDWEITYTMYDR